MPPEVSFQKANLTPLLPSFKPFIGWGFINQPLLTHPTPFWSTMLLHVLFGCSVGLCSTLSTCKPQHDFKDKINMSFSLGTILA